MPLMGPPRFRCSRKILRVARHPLQDLEMKQTTDSGVDVPAEVSGLSPGSGGRPPSAEQCKLSKCNGQRFPYRHVNANISPVIATHRSSSACLQEPLALQANHGSQTYGDLSEAWQQMQIECLGVARGTALPQVVSQIECTEMGSVTTDPHRHLAPRGS